MLEAEFKAVLNYLQWVSNHQTRMEILEHKKVAALERIAGALERKT